MCIVTVRREAAGRYTQRRNEDDTEGTTDWKKRGNYKGWR